MDLCLIANYNIWWHGPSWLFKCVEEWPDTVIPNSGAELPEFRTITVNTANVNACRVHKLLQQYSRVDKIIRIISPCLRFVSRLRSDPTVSNKLNPIDIDNATRVIYKSVQHLEFSNEIRDLEVNSKLNNDSKLITLLPFLDEGHVIRVGGRLK